MAKFTEIYMCREGQRLRDGKMEVSYTITEKYQAARDARARCQRNGMIKRVAHYAVNETGEPRNFYVYTHESKSSAGGARRERRGPARATGRSKRKTSWLARLIGAFQ